MKLKPSTKLIFTALFALTACGKIETPTVSKKVQNNTPMPQMAVVDVAKFTSDCATKSGVLMANNTVCVTAASASIPGSNGSMQEFSVTQNFAPGMAMKASGNVTDNSVQIFLNGSYVSPVPQPAFLRINGSGNLTVKTQPGNWTAVNVTVYTCFDASLNRVYCPAL
jgi:hypothetical protein